MKSLKHIVIIGSAHPLRGGLVAFNERLAREYMAQADNVEIWSFSLQYPGWLFPGKTQYSNEPAPADIRIVTRINSINPLNWICIGRAIKEINPDLVIVKFWMPYMAPCLGTICRIIRRNSHTKIISIIDNIIPHEKHPGDKVFVRYFLKPVDGFVAMSRAVLEELTLFDRRKPRIFCPHPLYDHYGIPVPKFEAQRRLGLDTQWKYILFFGFIREYKGLDLLLEAFADPRLLQLPVKLLVAGEFYENPDPYLKSIEKNHLEDRVILSHDFIPDTEVVNYFCASDLVVQTYKSATQSGVTQIAYHFNKPMIITNVGGLAEFVPDGKTGYVVNPDPGEIAEAVLKFFMEEKEDEFTACVAIEKEKYSWKNMITAIESLLNECLI